MKINGKITNGNVDQDNAKAVNLQNNESYR